MIDMDQFQNGAAGITVEYFARDPASGDAHRFHLRLRRLHHQLHPGCRHRQRDGVSIHQIFGIFQAAGGVPAGLPRQRAHGWGRV